VILALRPDAAPLAAFLVLAAWFFDRADGQLARLQGTTSSLGAWLDANVDELHDIGWHVALAFAAASQTVSPWPWLFLFGFLGGKYLFMHGLMTEQSIACDNSGAVQVTSARAGCLRSLYHLPGNADVRVHLLIAAVVTGWLTPELALIGVYYNLRWIVRYGLVAHRLRGDD
jgi:phosphatidylglycerophosphate synthase